MAVDKKSDYVGTHGGAYLDNDGQRKQFTYIDHDVKASIFIPASEEEMTEVRKQLREYRPKLIQRILDLPPTMCPDIFKDFTIRGDIGKIKWDETMLKDEGVPEQKLNDIHTLTTNRIQLHSEGLL